MSHHHEEHLKKEHCHHEGECSKSEHNHHGDEGCSCCGHYHHEENRKTIYIRLMLGVLFFLLIIILPVPSYLLIIPYLVLGYDCIWTFFKNIKIGRVFDEAFLMTIATVGAIILDEYTEACAVMFFYQLGELLGDITADKCRNSIKESFDFAPEFARRITENGFEMVSPHELKINERIAVFAGEKIACDGFVYKGDSYVDTSSLTGESMPVHISDGKKVLGGAINLDSPVEIRIMREYKDSSVAKVVRMLEDAAKNKAKSERFITAFSKKYTPAVVLTALISAFLLPLLPSFTLQEGIYTALMFLVVSCPCALVISIPLTLFAGVGRASKEKILFKGNNSLEQLYKIKNFAFDKTGTLTGGKFQVSQKNMADEDFEILGQLERYSNHPLANIISKNAKEPFLEAKEITEIKGMGISAIIGGVKVIAGNEKLMQMYKIEGTDEVLGTVIHLAVDGVYKGYVKLSDELRRETKEIIGSLKKKGAFISILSGDSKVLVKKISEEIGADSFFAELLPEEKVSIAEELKKKEKLLYVGDGINDAPVLAAADIGVSMGGAGSDVAIKNSDIILLEDSLEGLDEAIKISKKTMRIVFQNIAISIGIKVIVMLLGFFNIASMPLAVFADVGVMIIAVLNAARAMK